VALFLQGNCLALCGGENYCGPFDILPRHKGKLIQTIQKTSSRARFVPSLFNKKEKQPNNVVGAHIKGMSLKKGRTYFVRCLNWTAPAGYQKQQ
jgi:hypothetical protein